MARRSPSLSSADERLYEIARGRPRLRPGAGAQSRGARRLGELSAVTAMSVPRSTRRIQYWTFSGVGWEAHRLPQRLSYDLTFVSPRPIGWECAKTHGHAHCEPELYEVLEGSAAFLIQDLGPGPAADFVALIEAEAGDCVVIPPCAQHVTVNRGTSMLVVADVIPRRVRHGYAALAAARGAAYFQRVDGEVLRNPHYAQVPSLARVSASEWSDAMLESPLYGRLVTRPADFDWLLRINGFGSRFAELSRKLASSSRLLDDQGALS